MNREYSNIHSIDKLVSTPFYLMYPDVYEHNICSFLGAFKAVYGNVLAGYSFKTNYVPALCLIAKQLGCYAEVVSEMEFRLAQRLGFEHIIFNGPIKTEKILAEAISAGAIINLDSEYEVDNICQYLVEHPQAKPHIGIRINIRLTGEDGKSVIQCGLRQGRFGFSHDNLGKVIARLKGVGVDIVSLHGHTSSSDRAVINYKVIAKQMLKVCEDFLLDGVQYFDIGGGFFGAAAKGIDLAGRPMYQDYAKVVLDEVLANEWFKAHQPAIVIEPGSSVVSNVFEYVTKIYQNKQIEDVHFVTVDGSVFDVKPTMHSNNLPFYVVRRDNAEGEDICDVVGSTCMEKDVILKDVTLPTVKKGDYLVMRGVGAYTICLTPTFINFLSPIVSIEGSEYKVVRRRQNVDDVLGIYSFEK